MRREYWFGTFEKMRWIPAPLTGAESSPEGWEASATLLSGGAMQRNSWASHRNYTFAWGDASSRQAAQIMQNYANGTYGRGLIYFHGALSYDINVLPAYVADPSMALDFEGPSLVPGGEMSGALFASTRDLPIKSVTYTIPNVGIENALPIYVPIPQGYDLHLGALYAATGDGGVFASPVNHSGVTLTEVKLTAVADSDINYHPDTFSSSSYRGVYLWFGKNAATTSTISPLATTGRLYHTGAPGDLSGWYGGQGNSGCRFVGKPTYIEYTGVNGGQVGYAATLREVGAWGS